MYFKKEKKLVSSLLLSFITTFLLSFFIFLLETAVGIFIIPVKLILGILLLGTAVTLYCRVFTEREMKRSRRNIIVLAAVALNAAIGDGLLPLFLPNNPELPLNQLSIVQFIICFLLFSAGAYLLMCISKKYEETDEEKKRAPKSFIEESSIFRTRFSPMLRFWMHYSDDNIKQATNKKK